MEFEDEMAAEDLFGDDRDVQSDNENGNVIEEAIEAPDTTKKPKDESEQPKKRIIRNPQPKLDPDRICGARGIPVLPDVFADFKPKGGDHVFEDLDVAMKKMEHWAHRLYPKLPFDDVMNRISFLGKRMAIQTNVKKIRMGMEPLVNTPIVPEDDKEDDNDQDTTKRYDDSEFPTEDVFEKLVADAEFASEQMVINEKVKSPAKTLTDDQKERMERNRKLAAEKRKAKQMEQDFSRENEDDEQITFLNHDDTKDNPMNTDKENIEVEKDNIDDEKENLMEEDEQPLSQVFDSNKKSPLKKDLEERILDEEIMAD